MDPKAYRAEHLRYNAFYLFFLLVCSLFFAHYYFCYFERCGGICRHIKCIHCTHL